MTGMGVHGEFADRTIVVTGGAAGIGRAIVEDALRRGATVVALDLDPSDVPDGVTGIPCDISDSASVAAAFATITERFGRVDVLVNNAGIGAFGTVEAFTDAEWSSVLGVNVAGTARVSAAALPLLRAAGGGVIVNISSVAASTGIQQRALYSASKGAVQALTLAMAADHVHEGIRVVAVAPGTADTPWVSRMVSKVADPVAEMAAMHARQPIGRLVKPEEVAQAVLFLAGQGSGATTGTVLTVDGGFSGLRVRPVQPS
jgi:NAD(P)-dependent dehydrogenase (short-subunit alcohol dehydrogenase family)